MSVEAASLSGPVQETGKYLDMGQACAGAPCTIHFAIEGVPIWSNP